MMTGVAARSGTDGDGAAADASSGSRHAPSWRRSRLVRRGLLGGLALVVTVAAGVPGSRWLHWRWTHVSETDARVAGDMITLASRVDGWLVQRPVIDGDAVNQGAPVARIDDRDARLRLAAIEANLAAAEAQIHQLTVQRDTTAQAAEAGIDNAKAQINVTEVAIAGAGHQLQLAEAEFQRSDTLLKNGNTSQQIWDKNHAALLQWQDTRRQTEAELASRRAALATAQAQLGQVAVLERQIEVAQQQKQALAAQAAQIRQEIDDRVLRAPSDGVVDKTFAQAGDYVKAGQWIMMVHEPAGVWIEANIKETEVGRVRVGEPAEVTVDAYPDLVLRGKGVAGRQRGDQPVRPAAESEPVRQFHQDHPACAGADRDRQARSPPAARPDGRGGDRCRPLTSMRHASARPTVGSPPRP